MIVLLLPFPLLKSIRTAQRQEFISLIVLFTLGIITIAVSAGRFATMLTLGNDISLCKLVTHYPCRDMDF